MEVKSWTPAEFKVPELREDECGIYVNSFFWKREHERKTWDEGSDSGYYLFLLFFFFRRFVCMGIIQRGLCDNKM